MLAGGGGNGALSGWSLGRDLEETHERSDPVLAQRQNHSLNLTAMMAPSSRCP